MVQYIPSIMAGLVVGVIYAFLFLSSFELGPSWATSSNFRHVLTFILRFIFIIVVAVAMPIYFNINAFWFLLSLGVTFWVIILTKLKVK